MMRSFPDLRPVSSVRSQATSTPPHQPFSYFFPYTPSNPGRPMRLLERNPAGKFILTKDFVGNDEIPPYAILSHTWNDGEEVTFEDLTNDTGEDKPGYEKIRFCGERARHDGLQYIW